MGKLREPYNPRLNADRHSGLVGAGFLMLVNKYKMFLEV